MKQTPLKLLGVLAALAAAALVLFVQPAAADHNFDHSCAQAGGTVIEFSTTGDAPLPTDTTGPNSTVVFNSTEDGEPFTVTLTGTQENAAGEVTAITWQITQGDNDATIVVVIASEGKSGQFEATAGTGLSGSFGPSPLNQELSHLKLCVNTRVALAVTTSSLRATRYGKAVVLRWRTASEVDTLGFQVYRLVRGHRVKLSKRIIPAASLVNSRSSNGYSFRARLSSRRIAATSRFVLAEVHNDGSRTWYGPVRAVAAT